IERLIEVALVAGRLAEAARHPGQRSLAKAGERERGGRDQERRRHPGQGREARRGFHVWGLAGGAAVSAAPLAAAEGMPPLQVEIEEWSTPRLATGRTHPHDPAVAPDGAAWYTGQQSNVLGRVDPKTGTIKEYPLPTPDSGAHGLVADKDGNIWYTGNSAALIGRLDPKTGKVTEYKMPDPKARDPHTPIFDRNGVLWFTVQGGN